MAGPWEQYSKQKKPWEMYQQQPEQTSVPGQILSKQELQSLTPEQKQQIYQSDVPTVGPTGEVIKAPPKPEPSFGEKAVGAGEAALSMGTAATTGAAGMMYGTLKGLADEIRSGNIGTREAADRVEQEALKYAEKGTYSPRTETGQQYAKTAGELAGEYLQPMTGMTGVSSLDTSLKIPKTERLPSNITQAIVKTSPEINKLKAATKEAYKALDNTGIKIKPKVYDRFVDNLSAKMKKEGIDKTLHPKATAVMKRMEEDKGTFKTPSELETLRKIAKDAANSIDAPESRLGTIIVKKLDKSIDDLSSQIGGQFKQARALAKRGFKSEAITDMIENASHTASGLENGLRIEARKILKSKAKRRGFTADEKAMLSKIEQGTTAANTAKFLGKFGISEGQATSMLGASIGAAGGGAIGASFGGPAGAGVGALTIPALGQFAKKTAQRLTLDNTKLLDSFVRAGENAKEIAKAYLKNVPKSERNVSDLTDLLLNSNLTLKEVENLTKSNNKFISDASYYASYLRKKAQQATKAGIAASPELQNQGNKNEQ